jgi:carboxymethylenebutenolidase
MREEPPALTQSEARALTQNEIDQRVFDLYDEYCHGRIDRREFLQRASALTIGGASTLAMAQSLLPRYALAQTISFNRHADQGSVRDLPVGGRHLGHDARGTSCSRTRSDRSPPSW